MGVQGKKRKKEIKWQPQQKEVLNFNEKKDLIIFASAGSGKTTVMVERISRYLVEGGDINKIVVLTFTNNSANDMKEKIISTLKDEISKVTDEELAEKLRKQIFEVPQSDIGTIDGFCNNIVQKYYETIGISPGLTVMSASEADALFDEAILLEMEESIGKEDKGFKEITSFFYSGRNLNKIKEIVKEINKKLSSYPYPEEEMEKIKKSCSLTNLETIAFQQFIERRKRIALGLKRNILLAQSEILDNSYPVELDYDVLLNLLSSFFEEYIDIRSYIKKIEAILSKMPSILYAKACKNKVEREKYNAMLKQVSSFFETLAQYFIYEEDNDRFVKKEEGKTEVEKMEFASRKVLLNILDFAQRTMDRYNLMKANENKMTFSDIERYALRILSKDGGDGERIKSDIAEEITSEKEYIFIDEYQDTNYLQEEILEKISNNNVFMVGDIKQSIYMFRNSEPDIMKGKKDIYKDKPYLGEVKVLNDNFRSHEEILEFVNEVFSSIMTEDFGKVAYREEAKLTSPKIKKTRVIDAVDGREEIIEEGLVLKKPGVPSVTVKMFSKKGEDSSGENESFSWENMGIYSPRKAPLQDIGVDKEAEWVANAILTMVGNEEIYDAKRGSFRKIEFEDIVILQRNRKTEPYVAVFSEKGIPFELVGGEGALLKDDINVLNSVLKVISNPRQDYPLVMMLTSFIGKLTMEELLEIRKTRKEESLREKASVGRDANENRVRDKKEESLYDAIIRLHGRVGEKCRQALATIDKYRKHADMMDVPSLLNKIVSETGYDAEMLSSPEERISSFNIYVEYLRGKEYSSNVESYLKWLDKDLDIDVKLPGSSANCVRINTIHGSKGLEYPVVFFTNSDQGYRKNIYSGKDILFDSELGIASKFVDVKNRKLIPTISFESILERQEEREKEEQMRLLYVVLTRAKNRLFITGTKIIKGVENLLVPEINTYSKLIEYAALSSKIVANAYDNYEPKQDIANEIGASLPVIIPTEKTIDFHKYENLNSTKIHNKYAVTKMPELDPSTTLASEESSETIPIMVAQIEEVGTTYHQILEKIDFSKRSYEEVVAQIDQLFLQGSIRTKVPRSEIVDDYIHKALNNPLFTSLDGMEVIREKAFALYLPYNEFVHTSEVEDKVIVQGIIDLLAIQGDEVTIIDYKYSFSSPEKLKIRYQDQMTLYSLAVETLLKKNIVKKIIYAIPANRIIAFD